MASRSVRAQSVDAAREWSGDFRRAHADRTGIAAQAVWQSGYTYRWTTELAKQVLYNEIAVNPEDAETIGVADGDWLEISNQYSRCEGVTNVSDIVPKGVMSVIFGWQGPTDADGFGNPAFYGTR